MRRNTVLGLALAALLAAVAAVMVVIAHRPATQIAPGDRLFPQLAQRLNDAASITVVRAEGSFELVRKDERWTLPDKGGYPVRADLVRGALMGVSEVKGVEAKTRDAKLYERLQVEDAAAKDSKSTELVVKDQSGSVLADLIIGKRRASIGDLESNLALFYARKGGDAQSWLVIGALEPRGTAIDWTTRDVVDVPEDRIASVTLTGADGQSFVIERATPDDKDFQLRDKPADQNYKSQWDVNSVADALASLTFEDVRPAGDLAAPTAGAAKADYATKDGLHVVVTLVPREQEKWAIITASGDGDAAAKAAEINQTVSGWAYRLPEYKSNKVETKRADLLESADKPQG